MDSGMRVRQVKFDFSRTPSHWTAVPEFAQSMNASSTFIPHLERFLNKVMATARSEIKGDDAKTRALRSDISTFIKQEATHYATHAAFNEILPRDGYEKVLEFQAEIIADFARLIETKSLKFLCAYCEGFETLGPPSAIVWLDEIEDMLFNADPEAVRMWKWHLMEEYEHRTVCHDVFHRVGGGYFLRVYGLIYQLRHLVGYSKKVRAYLLAEDRKSMTAEEQRDSIRREKIADRRINKLMRLRLLRAMSPFYSPRKSQQPVMFGPFKTMIEATLR